MRVTFTAVGRTDVSSDMRASADYTWVIGHSASSPCADATWFPFAITRTVLLPARSIVAQYRNAKLVLKTPSRTGGFDAHYYIELSWLLWAVVLRVYLALHRRTHAVIIFAWRWEVIDMSGGLITDYGWCYIFSPSINLFEVFPNEIRCQFHFCCLTTLFAPPRAHRWPGYGSRRGTPLLWHFKRIWLYMPRWDIYFDTDFWFSGV